VIFQVLAAASMKMMAFWDIAACNFVQVDRSTTSIIRTLMMETVRTSEMSVCLYGTTRPYIQEGCHLHCRLLFYCGLQDNTISI
jgi:hypothetical protein